MSDAARLAAVRATGLPGSGDDGEFGRLARLAGTLLRAPLAFLTVVDDTRTTFAARLSDAGPSSLLAAESFCQLVVADGRPLLLSDVRLQQQSHGITLTNSPGLRAWAGYPVHTPEGYVLGTLCVADTVVREWTAQDAAVLADLAEIATREVALRAALRTARLAAAASERAWQREALFARIGELLTHGLELPAVWQAVVRLAVPALADYAFVHAVGRDDVLTGQYLLHRDPAQQALAARVTRDVPRRKTDSSGPGLVARTGLTQLVPVIEDVRGRLSPEQQIAVDHLASVSSITVALRARDQLLGVLTVVRTAPAEPYSTDDVELVEAIAARAALALDNALAYAQERRSSARLQQALLPTTLPRPGRLELATRYVPAGHRQLVGGDWYDAFATTAGSTVLVIGDVAGHDLSAAATMGQLRAMIRMAGHDGLLLPSQVLSTVDTATARLGTSVFTTAVVVRTGAPQAGAPPFSVGLTWSSAGHPPPVVFGPHTAASTLDAPPARPLGLDLGVLSPRRDQTTVLAPGQTLLLYTDGLIERRGGDLDGGIAALLACVGRHGELPLEEFCGAVLADLLPDSSDDVALLALRNPGNPPPASQQS